MARNSAYRPNLVTTLNSLASLYSDAHLFRAADNKEATEIERALAAQDAVAYRSELALTLSKLASLYRDMHRYRDAKALEAEASATAK